MTQDPWRYRCSHCESTQLQKRVTYDNPGSAIVPQARYHCQQCGSKRDVRKDMKTGELVA